MSYWSNCVLYSMVYSVLLKLFRSTSAEFQKIVTSHCVATEVTILTFVGAQSARTMQLKRTQHALFVFLFKVCFKCLLYKGNLKCNPNPNLKVRKSPLPLKLSQFYFGFLNFFCLFWGFFGFILIDSMRQEWWSVNVWLLHIWTKILLIRVSVEIARYEII